MAKPNNGVSNYVHDLQDAREDGGPRGIGQQVSDYARGHGHGGGEIDIADGVITVVKDEGGTQQFASFAEALSYSDDGDTLYVGKGEYDGAFNLDERVNIVGEEGAVIDGSGIATSAGTQSTIQLFDGFSGGSISGVDIVAVDNGGAVQSIYGEAISDITLSDNSFSAGANTAGSLVYLNPDVDGAVIAGNSFDGEFLALSPLLGIEGDNVAVTGNTFGATTGDYAKVEIFAGADGVTTDVVLTGNTGLDLGDVIYG